MSVIERIKQVINYKDISTRRFCIEIGVSNGFLDKVKDVGSEKLLKILNTYPDISPEWLLTGNGEMLKSSGKIEIKGDNKGVASSGDIGGSVFNNSGDGDINIQNNNTDAELICENKHLIKKVKNREEKISTLEHESISFRDKTPHGAENQHVAIKTESQENGIPLYDVSVSAGSGTFEDMIAENKVIGTYNIPNFKQVDWMIYIKGSSMYPKYSSGDIIACRVLHESRFIQWGKVYVIATREQGLLVKRIEEHEDENSLLLVSDNPSYKPFKVPKDEICGIAIVIGVIRLE